MKLKIFIPVLILFFFSEGCIKNNPQIPFPNNYSAEVANAWMQLHVRLTTSTPGFNSVASTRSLAYADLTLYESIAKGIPDGASVMEITGKTQASAFNHKKSYYWPASANAAMALITKNLFGNASTAGLHSIDSLEASFTARFQSQASEEELQNAVAYGRAKAADIFEWSKSDGGHEAFLHITEPGYVPPVRKGLWIPTPAQFGAPIYPYWGKNRSFVPGIADITLPAPPIAYSEEVNSQFYQMVNELYTISLSLTPQDSTIAKFWADIPGNYNVPAHATNILTQLIHANNFNLEKAAKAYARHGIALNDACIAVFHAKYKYNQVRPISYIRNVMGHTNWNTVVPTPAHPEYTAAHAVISAAAATVLEDFFGKNFHFTDRTYEKTFGVRSFNSFDEYAEEAGRSRLLGGIHYRASIATGLVQGKQIGRMVNALKF